MHNSLEHDLPNRFPEKRHRRTLRSGDMRHLARNVLVPVGLLWIAALSAGCNQIFGITKTSLAPREEYTCGCACSGGGQSFSISSNVCLPEDLNPELNPNLPSDFVPSAAAVQDDCHVRVERNVEQMARQCFADRIRCTCEASADLNFSVGACFTHCFGEDLAADCSNFDPQTGNVTATNVPGQEPVCVDGKSTSTTPAALGTTTVAVAH